MSDKRRVVRGPQDDHREPAEKGPSLKPYSQVVSDSNDGTLTDAQDTEYGQQFAALDQYPKLKRNSDGTAIIEQPDTKDRPKDNNGPRIPHSDQPDQKPKPQQAQGKSQPIDWRAKRGDQISSLLDKYTSANQQSANRQRMISGQATSIAFSNPAAAKVYQDGYSGWINEPKSSINEGNKSVADRQGLDKGASSQASTDEQNDKSSNVSDLARKQFKRLTGYDAPENSTAADIKRVLPESTVVTKRDTSYRDQDMKQQTATQNRLSKERQGTKNRGSHEKIAQGNQKAGIGRVIIGGVLAQDKANSQGTSGRSQQIANAATIPDQTNPGGYLVSKPGMPPDKTRADLVAKHGGQSAKYLTALKTISEMVKKSGGRPQILQKNWPAFQSALAQAVQTNIKYVGNGVANYADITQALKAIGNPTDVIDFIRKGMPQKIEQAQKGVLETYKSFYDANGYMQSDKPSDTSSKLGTGGSDSSKKPVNPGLGAAANQAANQFGFPAVTGTPETPPIPSADDDKKKKAADALSKMGF